MGLKVPSTTDCATGPKRTGAFDADDHVSLLRGVLVGTEGIEPYSLPVISRVLCH